MFDLLCCLIWFYLGFSYINFFHKFDDGMFKLFISLTDSDANFEYRNDKDKLQSNGKY